MKKIIYRKEFKKFYDPKICEITDKQNKKHGRNIEENKNEESKREMTR